MNDLINLFGEKNVKKLKNGTAILKIWRRTTPHNYWLEDKKGKMLWHSNDENHHKAFSIRIKYFIKLEDSGNVITRSLFGGENGLSEESTYTLKDEI